MPSDFTHYSHGKVYRAYAMPGLFREFTHDKKQGFWAGSLAGSRPGFDQEGCKFPFNELNF